MAFLEFFLSPCGCIGRAKWWLGQLLLAPAMAVLAIYLFFIFASAAGFDDPLKLLDYIKAHYSPAHPLDPHLVARFQGIFPRSDLNSPWWMGFCSSSVGHPWRFK